MATPISLRLEDELASRLSSAVRSQSGLSQNALAARLIDEGLRREHHPDIVFVDGPTGRRAAVTHGQDVWEIIRSVKLLRAADSTLSGDALLLEVEARTGTPVDVSRAAVTYWADYPNEVDERIALDEEAADRLFAAAERSRGLVGE